MVPLTAKHLQQTRTQLGLSQEHMARLLGVSFASVNRWEGGHSAPVGATLDLYAALYSALKAGYAADAILSTARGDRGIFLYKLFAMAYGGGKRGVR